MTEKKFDPDIAGFLADDLAELQSSEPAPVERHDPDQTQPELIDSLPPGSAPADSSPEPLDRAAEETPSASVPKESGVDQPDLFSSAPPPAPVVPEFRQPPAIPGFVPATPPAPAPVEPSAVAPVAVSETAAGSAPAPAAPPRSEPEPPPSGEEPESPIYSPPSPVAPPPPTPVTPPTGPVYSPQSSGALVETPRPAPVPPVVPPPDPVAPPPAPIARPPADAVTVVEVAPSEQGGVREAALPGDRSRSPLSPAPAKRTALNHPIAKAILYGVIVVLLTFVFLVLLINVVHLG